MIDLSNDQFVRLISRRKLQYCGNNFIILGTEQAGCMSREMLQRLKSITMTKNQSRLVL